MRHDRTVTDRYGRTSLELMVEHACLWSVDYEGGAETIAAAAEALADGVDSPGLREVAGLPSGATWWENEDTLRSAFTELGLVFPEKESRCAKLGAARALCEGALLGRLTPRELTESLHSLVGHEFSDATEDLVLLDDEGGWSPSQPAEWDERVLDAARVFLGQEAGRSGGG